MEGEKKERGKGREVGRSRGRGGKGGEEEEGEREGEVGEPGSSTRNERDGGEKGGGEIVPGLLLCGIEWSKYIKSVTVHRVSRGLQSAGRVDRFLGRRTLKLSHPSPCPLTGASDKAGSHGRRGLRAPATSPGEGAQVTATPGNRCPGNRWQLQEGDYVTARLRPSRAQAP